MVGQPGKMVWHLCYKHEQAGRDWLKDTGIRNAEELNLVLKETANSWFAKVKQTAELQS